MVLIEHTPQANQMIHFVTLGVRRQRILQCQIQRHFRERISWNLWVIQCIHYPHIDRHKKANEIVAFMA